MTFPLVSIQVVTYNSEEDVNTCLDAIESCLYPNIEVIVVDNHSSDNTVAKIKKHSLFRSKKLHSVFLQDNFGYAGGHNIASEYAKGAYLFLLNADSILSPNCIEPLVARFRLDDNLFACQPLILLSEDHKRINLTGKVTHYLGYDWLRDYQSVKIPPAGEIISISGAGVLLHAVSFKKIGKFDQEYFMYYEDSDISWRARLAGFSLVFEPKSILFHNYKYIPHIKQQSLQQKIYFIERNRLMTVIKNYNIKTLIILLPALVVNELALIFYTLLSGALFAKLRSYASLWSIKATLLQSRNNTQQMRKVSDAEVIAKFKTKIEFEHFSHPALKYVLNPFFSIYWFLVKIFI